MATTRISTSATITYSTIASNAKRYIVNASWFYYIAYAKYTSYYIVKYNGNGATSGSMSDDEFLHGTTYYLKTKAYSKTATITYNANGGTAGRSSNSLTASFQGWATSASGDVVYANQAAVTDLTSTAGGTFNLYAKWSAFSSVSLPLATKPGSVFAGWYTAASGGTRVGGSGDTYTATESITLYAHWTPYRTVIFSPEGGTITNNVYYKHVLDGTAYGDLPTATRDGYTFLGWFTSASGGTQVTAASIVQSSDHILYAQWQAETGSSILYFNPAGGTCATASKSATTGAAYGELPTPTKTGYTFLGWFRSTIGSDQVTAATIAAEGSLTVYAHWQGVTLTITFDPNEGTVDEAPRSVVYGQQLGKLPVPTRTGFSFVGWYASGVKYTASDYPTTSLTLVASWTEAELIDWWSVTVY